MTTNTRSRPAHSEITRAQWCARNVRDADIRRVAHKVDLTQAGRRGGIRDALCGRPAAKWRPVAELDQLDGHATCPDCADVVATATVRTAAGTAMPSPAQRPSRPREDPIARTPARPDENTQVARTQRRAAYRNSWLPQRHVDYVPAGNDRRPAAWRDSPTAP